MAPGTISLGTFDFEPRGERIVLRTPQGSVETDLHGFLRGIKHLLKMGLDLEGEAELNGGFVFRAEGEIVRLRLGQHVETFPLPNVAEFFNRLATELTTDC